MDAVEWSVLGGMAVLIVGCLVYAVVRLRSEPRTDPDPRSQRVARVLLYPRLFDPLLAKRLSSREKIGWLVVLVVAAAAVVLT